MRRFLRHEVDTITLVERLQQQLEVAKTHLQGGGSPVRTFSVDFFLKAIFTVWHGKICEGRHLVLENKCNFDRVHSEFICVKMFKKIFHDPSWDLVWTPLKAI